MYQPFLVGNRFRIVPPHTLPAGDARTDLILARGAFGSGEHETTASCLEALEELPEVRDARLLDLGSGTGVLAIGALLLGAQQAVCVDISPEAVDTARQNCRLNAVEERVLHLTGSLSSVADADFDLILANIYGDLLVDFAGELVAKARPGAWLLLSGILWEYNFEVRRLYENLGCEVVRNRMLDEFSTVLLKKT